MSAETARLQKEPRSCEGQQSAVDIERQQRNRRRQLFAQWTSRYAKSIRPVPVRFADLTDRYHLKDRHTHVVHSYPAKLLSVIPEFFIDVLTEPGDVVLDPFCGSGTVPLEAILAGRRALAAEVNPLARLITRVKTTRIPEEILRRQWSRLKATIDLRRSSVSDVPVILKYWHSPRVLRQMSAIRNALAKWRPTCAPEYCEHVRDFFRLMFSSIVRRVSLADPRIAPPVRLKPRKFKLGSAARKRVLEQLNRKRTADCMVAFATAVEMGIRRVATLDPIGVAPCMFVSHDAREVPASAEASLILTSPPYMAAQKYTRTTSLEMYWLGLLMNASERSELEKTVIGSERPNLLRGQQCPELGVEEVDFLVAQLWSSSRSRAKIVFNYFADMFTVMTALERALADGGRMVVVVGNNTVCGKTVPVYRILERWCREHLALETDGILVDPIRQYGLITKRHRTAGIIKREYVLMLRKLQRGTRSNVSA